MFQHETVKHASIIRELNPIDRTIKTTLHLVLNTPMEINSPLEVELQNAAVSYVASHDYIDRVTWLSTGTEQEGN